ncbi:MAG: YjgP/YjgQ family permease [Planctomycetota bacterium]|nr:MAG: YjgP/YjgQ family permease [Planctomycetota bacterium]
MRLRCIRRRRHTPRTGAVQRFAPAGSVVPQPMHVGGRIAAHPSAERDPGANRRPKTARTTMVRLLQRYIYAELLRVFLVAVTAMTVVLVIVGLIREVAQHGLGPVQMLQIMPFVAPSLLPFTIPATFLLAVSLVYGRMAAANEFTALKAAGISIWTVLKPAVALAVILSVFSFVMTDHVIPWSIHNIQRIVTNAMEQIFLDVLRNDNHMFIAAHHTTITVEDVRGRQLIRPSFRYAPGNDVIQVQAEIAELRFDLEKEQVILHMVNGHIDLPGKGRVYFAEQTYPFPVPQIIRKSRVRHLHSVELLQRVRALRAERREAEQQRDLTAALLLGAGQVVELLRGACAGYQQRLAEADRMIARLRTEFHSRIALSCGCVFLVLVGAPFALIHAQDEFLLNFFRCFVPVLLLYYPATLLAINLAKSGTISPVGWLWVGNAILLVIGVFFLRKAARH